MTRPISRFPVPLPDRLPYDIRENFLHGALLRICEENPLLADPVATNLLTADLTPQVGPCKRMANITAMRPNDEFSLMGRLPRA